MVFNLIKIYSGVRRIFVRESGHNILGLERKQNELPINQVLFILVAGVRTPLRGMRQRHQQLPLASS